METNTNHESIPLTFDVQLVPKDVILFNLIYLWGKLKWVILLGTFIFLLEAAFLLSEGHFSFLFFASAPLLFIIFLLVNVFIRAKKNTDDYARRTYTVTREGVSFHSDTLQVSYDWSYIKEIKATKRYYFLFINTNAAFILPLTCFQESSKLETFKSYLPALKRKSRKNPFKSVIFFFVCFLVLIAVVSFFSGSSIDKQNEEAFLLIDKGEFEEGLKILEVILEKEPDNDIALNNKGWALSQIGRYEEALRVLKRSIEIGPSDAFEYTNIGNTYFGLKRYPEAIRAYNKAVELGIDEKTASALYGLGVTYFEKQGYVYSIEYFKQYLSYIPDDIDAHWFLVDAYEKNGRVQKAIDTLNAILAIDPSDIEAYKSKGDLYLKSQYYPEAEDIYTEIIKKFPDLPHGYYGMAQVLSAQNKRTASFSYLQDAISIDPFYSENALTDPFFESVKEIDDFKDLFAEAIKL